MVNCGKDTIWMTKSGERVQVVQFVHLSDSVVVRESGTHTVKMIPVESLDYKISE